MKFSGIYRWFKSHQPLQKRPRPLSGRPRPQGHCLHQTTLQICREMSHDTTTTNNLPSQVAQTFPQTELRTQTEHGRIIVKMATFPASQQDDYKQLQQVERGTFLPLTPVQAVHYSQFCLFQNPNSRQFLMTSFPERGTQSETCYITNRRYICTRVEQGMRIS